MSHQPIESSCNQQRQTGPAIALTSLMNAAQPHADQPQATRSASTSQAVAPRPLFEPLENRDYQNLSLEAILSQALESMFDE